MTLADPLVAMMMLVSGRGSDDRDRGAAMASYIEGAKGISKKDSSRKLHRAPQKDSATSVTPKIRDT